MYVSVQRLSNEEKYSCLEWVCLEEQDWVSVVVQDKRFISDLCPNFKQ